MSDPDFWAPMWGHIGYDRVEAADFEVGGRRFAVFARDWRTAALPPKWADLLWDRTPAGAADTVPAAAVPEGGSTVAGHARKGS